jgi:hypothetical protein
LIRWPIWLGSKAVPYVGKRLAFGTQAYISISQSEGGRESEREKVKERERE